MIKQTWNIEEIEKLRILNLHEAATKKEYLIYEQTPNYIETTKTSEKVEFPTQNLQNLFKYGEWDSPELRQAIEALRPRIEQFIENSKANKFVLNINAGESQVTNPKGFEEKGSLALKRAQNVESIFRDVFSDLISKGTLQVNGPKKIEDVKIGETKYTKGSPSKDNPNYKFYIENIPNYKKEQFVTFNIVGDKETESTSVICTYKKEVRGGVAEASNNFIYLQERVDVSELNNGQKIRITLATYLVPDMLTVEAGGKLYSSGFVGEGNNEAYSILLATILGNTYKGSKPPSPLPQDIIPLDKERAHYFFDRRSDLEQYLGHVININWNRNPTRQVDQINWFTFETNPIKNSVLRNTTSSLQGYAGDEIIITKDASMKDVIIRVYSPLGTTVFNIEASCI
jgi:hypothetical protein